MANIAIECINFELEIRSIQNQLNDAIDEGAFQSFLHAQFEEEMQTQREIVRELQGEIDSLYETIVQPLEDEVDQLTLTLQEELDERNNLLSEQHELNGKLESCVVDALEMESAMEQMSYYQADLQIMFQNLRMNLEQNRIEMDYEQNVVLRRVIDRQQMLQSELDALEKIETILMQKSTDAETNRERVKMTAQQVSLENDALHKKLNDANEFRHMLSVNKSFFERMASNTRLSIHRDWVAGTGGRRGSMGSLEMSRHDRTKNSAE
eukprot:15285128-Ditylum_brightwellii.AAC.1